MRWPLFLTIPRKRDFAVSQDGQDYMRRWWVIPRNAYCNIYLHNFLHSDTDAALHDHMYHNI